MDVSKVDGRAALFLNLAKGARLEKAIIRAVKEFLKSKNVDDAVRLSYASKKDFTRFIFYCFRFEPASGSKLR